MKSIPPEIEALAPEGTQWFGGPVDRSTMTLRIACSPDECEAVSRSLDYTGHAPTKRWRLSAPIHQGLTWTGRFAGFSLGSLQSWIELATAIPNLTR
jgi:hypothetical protein